MSPVLLFLIPLAVGTTVGLLFHRYRIPGGVMVGAIVSVGALFVAWEALEPLPRDLRVVAQIAVGTIVGAAIRREPLQKLAASLWKIVPISIAIILGAVGCGLILTQLTSHDVQTMLLATVPGGAADVTAAALDLNGEVAVVAAFQLLRQLIIFLVIALIFGRPTRGETAPLED